MTKSLYYFIDLVKIVDLYAFKFKKVVCCVDVTQKRYIFVT